MPNRQVEADVDVMSANNSCDMPQYDVFNFEESPRKCIDDGLLRLATFNERENNNSENLELDKLPQILYEEVQSSISDWEIYMFCKEHEVLTKSVSSIEKLPDVRGCETVIQYPERSSIANSSFSCSNIEIRSHENIWTDDMSEEQKSKRKLYADAEKGRGNIAYREGDYTKACEHYSNSISAVPLKEVYNNRAQASIKMEKYSSALPDLNEVLKQDPLNLKALNRRAVCRHRIGMFHEALCDLQSVLDLNPKSKEALELLADVNGDIAGLKGRKYRMRLISDRYKTFEVDVSQLPVYAEYDGIYILEVDKSGCAKSCVCSYCIAEDQCSRYRSNTLRIKERPRWQRLTSQLLTELHLNVNATVTNATTSTNNAVSTNRCENSKNESSQLADDKVRSIRSRGTDSRRISPPQVRVNEKIGIDEKNSTANVSTSNSVSANCDENSKNKYSKLVDNTAGNSQNTSVDQSHEKLLRKKNLINAVHNSYNSSKSTSANVISTASINVIALPAASPSISQTKSMKDSQNLNHQRANSVENAMQTLQLEDSFLQNGDVGDILKNCSPALLKKKFDSRLDEATLKSLINFVCINFKLEDDWPTMSQYLRAIAELERFKIIISFIDSQTKNEIMSVFDKAINMKLEQASDLRSMFFASLNIADLFY